MFQYKTGSGVAQYKLTYPVVVWKFMLFHRLALKEDDAFNRLLSPSNHHFITILDFCSTILKQRCIPVEQRSRFIVRPSTSDLTSISHLPAMCAAAVCLCGTAFISTDVISNCDTPFHSSVPEIVF